MKNIHLIPTDKPSRLCINGKNGQHIYITSDEEIKEGNWFYDLDTKYIKVKQSWENSHLDFNGKKIILTTDQDLIKDGVQAIDDEFLEWFVKNPSCEEVKVVEKQHFEADKSKRKNPLNGVYYSYKIIIPKEEPKTLTKLEIARNIEAIGIGKKEEPKQETINLDKLESQLDDALEKETKESLTNWLHSKRNEQETLEEAAETNSEKHHYAFGQQSEFYQLGFIECAKWQAKKMYSEEDMIEFAEWIVKESLSKNKEGWTLPKIFNRRGTTKELLQLWKEQQPKTMYYE